MNTISFPSLGIELTLRKTAFSIGSFSVQWYGIIVALGFALAVWYCTKRCVRFGISEDNLIDMALWATPAAVVGARLYYVVFNWAEFKDDIASVLYIWNGGIAIYGALIFGVLAAVIYCVVKKIKIGNMLDLAIIGFVIGQCVGRWGNFVNAEAYGNPVNDWFLGMSINGGKTVHPNFLYESLWNFLGFLLLHFTSKKRRFYGQTFLTYLIWYGVGRGVFEGIRGPDTLMFFGTDLRVSQVLGFLSALAAAGLLVYKLIFSDRQDTITLLTNDQVLEAKALAAAKARLARENIEISGEPEEVLGKVEEEDPEDVPEEAPAEEPLEDPGEEPGAHSEDLGDGTEAPSKTEE